MAMMRSLAFVLVCLPPVTADDAPFGQVAIGAFQQELTQGFGPWKGRVIDLSLNPWGNGKILASVVGFERPEGNGTVFSIGKYQEFKGGYAYLGVGSSTGADYLPTLQVAADVNFQTPWTGWVLGGGVTQTRVRDGHENLIALFGPAFYAGPTVTTARVYRNRSNPGGLESSGVLVQFRHGVKDHEAWQSLRITVGGEAYQSLLVREAVHGRGLFVGLETFWPLRGGWNLQAGVDWGEKFKAYRLWGGSLRVGHTF